MRTVSERTEIRDGREFRVLVLPEAKPRPAKRGMRTKAEARAIAMTGRDRIVTCHICKRSLPRADTYRLSRKNHRRICGECRRAGRGGKKGW